MQKMPSARWYRKMPENPEENNPPDESRTATRKTKEENEMKDYAALYDGGWRADDLYEIQKEYDLDDFDRDEIVSWLWQYEHK